MWVVFFCNIAAGVAIIALQSPLMQELWSRGDHSIGEKALEGIGATLIAVSSLFNGFGRIGWGAASDRIGRVQAFRIMLLTELAAFVAMIFVSNPWVFGALVCYVLLCYGGGFGTMPSFILDVFGAKRMPALYGAILTAWAAAGASGPLVFVVVRKNLGLSVEQASTWSFAVLAGFLAVGAVLSFLLSNRPVQAVKQT
jgi:OFA family oxalate/formate antiporter-like MFS transporter